MKNIKYFLRISLLLALFAGFGYTSFAQGPPPPPESGSHGSTTNQPAGNGGSAPIGGGLAILISLGAAYGGMKFYRARKES